MPAVGEGGGATRPSSSFLTTLAQGDTRGMSWVRLTFSSGPFTDLARAADALPFSLIFSFLVSSEATFVGMVEVAAPRVTTSLLV